MADWLSHQEITWFAPQPPLASPATMNCAPVFKFGSILGNQDLLKYGAVAAVRLTAAMAFYDWHWQFGAESSVESAPDSSARIEFTGTPLRRHSGFQGKRKFRLAYQINNAFLTKSAYVKKMERRPLHLGIAYETLQRK